MDIYVMDLAFSLLSRVTTSSRDDVLPVWSPDGTRLAFVSNRDFDLEVYLGNTDGTGQTRLTNQKGVDTAPAWSPDGQTIAFEHGERRPRHVYSVNADGSGIVRLTQDADSAAVIRRFDPGSR